MKFTKTFSDTLDHCYAIMHLTDDDHDYIIVASEENQPCYAYDLNDNFKRIIVWPDVGGTMTLVRIPGTMNFLATQRFYPGFNSAKCRIVKETFNGEGWDQSVVGDFPYVHRFDIIPHGEGLWFVGCSIANSKKNTDDWTDPGKVWVGDYNDQKEEVENLRALDIRLTKNHGYKNMGGYSLITSADGVYRLDYPTHDSDWMMTKFSKEETSDIASADINGDGHPEYLAIEGFHGPHIRIYDDRFESIYYSEPNSPFGHAIWGGSIGDKQYFIFGWRQGSQELELISSKDGEITTQTIDKQVGPSNVTVFSKDNKLYLLSANREHNEIAIYHITDF
ncbi:hypothetical protein EFR98_10890 [Lentilactobacillus buchneri]|uniref:hypothetical protein n=1 Tax=Lentilactobacillus buchneri TaxID=1581 RepID=UPI0021A8E483|nr:hypothetical protein [Lentilactobacillus buchneri]MCT3557319.1 hypothetical protein [Lentilactobacillus buchneri]MCT3563253.1 hypothetical protein [Lentilactobacillus buchneri]